MIEPSPPATPAERRVRPDLAERFLRLIPLLKRRLEAGLSEDLRSELAAVTPYQIEALCHMGARGGVTMHDLAHAQGCGVSSATSLADRLHRHGLAERVPDPEDRRVVRLVPTSRAAALVERFRSARREAVLAALSALDDDEIEKLTALLQKVVGEDADD